jgi:cysteine synthase B
LQSAFAPRITERIALPGSALAQSDTISGSRFAHRLEDSPLPTFRTLESTVGDTPLVKLQRMPGATSNVVLAKLEGNNPAGSVKDRPALSMIVEAEKRGQIKPATRLIVATLRNTGRIALAMVAEMKVLPYGADHARTTCRWSCRQSMTAFGAELILVTKAQGMEGSRDLAEEDARRRQGHHPRPVFESGQSARALPRHRPELWRETEGRITHFVSAMAPPARSWACRSSSRRRTTRS